jgi:V-type H+-transporting ATPase subunit H
LRCERSAARALSSSSPRPSLPPPLRRRWADEDIEENIATLDERLADAVNELSAWDVYKVEVLSGRLEWSPPHTSEKFWRECAVRFEDNNFEVLATLIELLRTARDNVGRAIACFDIGQFAVHHPRGKTILQNLDCKTTIMA